MCKAIEEMRNQEREEVTREFVVVNVNILLYKKWKIFLYNYRCYASAS